MAQVGVSALTYKDLATRLDPGGKVDKIIELLSQENPMIDDIMSVQCNQKGSHKTTVRTGLPEPTWRMLNYGVVPSKSETAPVVDACGMLEDYCKVDKSLADISGDKNEFMLSESRAHLQSFQNTVEDALFYGNEADNPAIFTGLAPRYNSLSAPSGANIVDYEGSDNAGAQSSIWAVTWGENFTHGLYPEGSIGGWQSNWLGEDTLSDGAGGEYQGYRNHFKWDVGLTVRDWRYNGRIANVDYADLTHATPATAQANREKLLEKMIMLLYDNLQNVLPSTRLYVPRRIYALLQVAAMQKANVNLTIDQFGGRRVMFFHEVPIRRCDALRLTEDVVS